MDEDDDFEGELLIDDEVLAELIEAMARAAKDIDLPLPDSDE